MTAVLERGRPALGLEMATALERIKGRLLDRTRARSASTRTRLGQRYRLGAELGRGGLGVVFAARDELLDRDVAIKVLQRSVYTAADASDGDSKLIDEARALATLAHPNIVPIFDCGVASLDGDASQIYIVMERVPGTSLAAWLAQPRTVGERLTAFEQAAAGLAEAHRNGLVHRDFKPDNVLIDVATFPAPGSVKVTDFGLARTLGDSTSVDGAGGTPAYMAPEQRHRHRASPASDQFALCLALARALEIPVPPWLDEWPGESRALDPSSAPPALRRVLHRGMALDPADRFENIDALMVALRQAARGRSTWRAAALAALVAVGAIALANPTEGPRRTVAPVTATPSNDTSRVGTAVDDALGDLARGEEVEAQGALQRAHFAAALARDEQAAFDTAATLGYLAGFIGLGDEVTVARWLSEAQRLAQSPMQRARVAHVTATTALRDARYADAHDGFSRALDIMTEQPEATAKAIVTSRVGLGIAEFHLGRPDDARDTFASALAVCEDGYGPDDHRCATAMTNLANAEHRLGRTREAIEIAERALAIRERRSADHPRVADALVAIGTMWFTLGEYERAELCHRRATAIYEARLGDDSVHAATARYNLGLVYEMTDRADAAVATFRRTLAVFDAELAPDDPRRASVVGSLGTMLVEMGDHEAALPHLEEALSIHKTRATDPRSRASVRFSLAKSLAAAGEFARADALALAAREDLVSGHAPPRHVRLVEQWLADRGHAIEGLADAPG